jgi:hypothetical protein
VDGLDDTDTLAAMDGSAVTDGNAVTAYLFTSKRFMCGEYLCRHRIAPQSRASQEPRLFTEKKCSRPSAPAGLCIFAVLS